MNMFILENGLWCLFMLSISILTMVLSVKEMKRSNNSGLGEITFVLSSSMSVFIILIIILGIKVYIL